MELLNASATEIINALKARQVSSREVTSFYLDRIEKHNSNLNAFCEINKDALKQAEEIDARRAKGDALGMLAGLPLGVKDIICTEGIRTTAGSKILANFVPPYSATVIEKIKKCGGLILGKTNMDEFAMGSSNENSCFGPVKNPWNFEYVSGGSSGGSAAAVAAGLSPMALGTDTGGSIRQPAHFAVSLG